MIHHKVITSYNKLTSLTNTQQLPVLQREYITSRVYNYDTEVETLVSLINGNSVQCGVLLHVLSEHFIVRFIMLNAIFIGIQAFRDGQRQRIPEFQKKTIHLSRVNEKF